MTHKEFIGMSKLTKYHIILASSACTGFNIHISQKDIIKRLEDHKNICLDKDKLHCSYSRSTYSKSTNKYYAYLSNLFTYKFVWHLWHDNLIVIGRISFNK